MSAPALTDALPDDAMPIEEVAKYLGRSRRTLDRWLTGHPDELPRYTRTALDGTTRTLVSWRAVEVFCINHGKPIPPDACPGSSETVFAPDPSLSEQIATSDTPQTSEDIQPRTRTDNLSEVSGTVSANPSDTTDTASDILTTEVLQLRAEVARLTALLEAVGSSHVREVALLEARIMEMKTGHTREVSTLTAELAARRSEAAALQDAAERQRQREAALRWQTATLKSQRDQAMGELVAWASAGVFQRLTSKPRLMLSDTATGAQMNTSLDVSALQDGEG